MARTALNVDYDGLHYSINISFPTCAIGRDGIGNFSSLVGEITHRFFEVNIEEPMFYDIVVSHQARKEMGKDRIGFLERVVHMYNNKSYKIPLYVPF